METRFEALLVQLVARIMSIIQQAGRQDAHNSSVYTRLHMINRIKDGLELSVGDGNAHGGADDPRRHKVPT